MGSSILKFSGVPMFHLDFDMNTIQRFVVPEIQRQTRIAAELPSSYLDVLS